MLIDLGGGTNPHPRADIVIDLHHPVKSPQQDAATTPWTVDQVVGEDGIYHFSPGWTDGVRQVLERSIGFARDERFVSLCDETVDEIYTSHFLEHIPKGQPIINVMNEAWRVLKPGGTFTIILPLTGYTVGRTQGKLVENWRPYADPTHVNQWWFPEGLQYFCQQFAHADYGINLWAPLGEFVYEQNLKDITDMKKSFWTVRDGWEGSARLVKP